MALTLKANNATPTNALDALIPLAAALEIALHSSIGRLSDCGVEPIFPADKSVRFARPFRPEKSVRPLILP
jgi:hypothetical protein